jgi:hypothetical protein
MSKLKKHFEGNNDPIMGHEIKHYKGSGSNFERISMNDFLKEFNLGFEKKKTEDNEDKEA